MKIQKFNKLVYHWKEVHRYPLCSNLTSLWCDATVFVPLLNKFVLLRGLQWSKRESKQGKGNVVCTCVSNSMQQFDSSFPFYSARPSFATILTWNWRSFSFFHDEHEHWRITMYIEKFWSVGSREQASVHNISIPFY